MDTAVDSSVLWSIFKGEPDSAEWLAVLQRCAGEGAHLRRYFPELEIVQPPTSPVNP